MPILGIRYISLMLFIKVLVKNGGICYNIFLVGVISEVIVSHTSGMLTGHLPGYEIIALNLLQP